MCKSNQIVEDMWCIKIVRVIQYAGGVRYFENIIFDKFISLKFDVWTILNYPQDGNSGEDFNKDSIERDERRLTELGRRTVEIFVLAHIFRSSISLKP